MSRWLKMMPLLISVAFSSLLRATEEPTAVEAKAAIRKTLSTIDDTATPTNISHATVTVESIECDDAMLATIASTVPSDNDLARVERDATADSAMLPRLAAMLLARNNHGDASRALRLLEGFPRQHPTWARGSVQWLLLLARERVLARKGEIRIKSATNVQNNELITLRKELEEARKDRETARREIIELRRKLKDITSIEKSMDERKTH
ncbi:exported hypothetical protein [Gammaproteobacteria bacterium]